MKIRALCCVIVIQECNSATGVKVPLYLFVPANEGGGLILPLRLIKHPTRVSRNGRSGSPNILYEANVEGKSGRMSLVCCCLPIRYEDV